MQISTKCTAHCAVFSKHGSFFEHYFCSGKDHHGEGHWPRRGTSTGVNVTVQGTTIGAITDLNGGFCIKGTEYCSCIGIFVYCFRLIGYNYSTW